ncbi:hypothetical protein CMO93_03255 [Candidatus Woesearchaeota archaeon]|nr:hypothetical protein [Candidatus Woesearchaeota archaeon]|tara:strand:- start:788 stop:1066 length:279 start_codon:yes stop_codon:yes gene_type:complete
MRKKAQGLSINTIIVAAIALIVLVVLVAIFTGRLGSFSKGLGEVTNCDQICKARGYDEGGQPGDSNPDAETYNELIGARDNDNKQCYCVQNT